MKRVTIHKMTTEAVHFHPRLRDDASWAILKTAESCPDHFALAAALEGLSLRSSREDRTKAW